MRLSAFHSVTTFNLQFESIYARIWTFKDFASFGNDVSNTVILDAGEPDVPPPTPKEPVVLPEH